jgi:exosome complex component RRP4
MLPILNKGELLASQQQRKRQRHADASTIDDVSIVTPGEVIVSDSKQYLRGHGTYIDDRGRMLASVAGTVEKVNKLISVRPSKARYVGEVGDVVVGRVVEVLKKKWLVDIGCNVHSMLLLTSINLSGGQQRRRTTEDQLQMREYYVEGDLISAEVQNFFNDGAASIHARSLKYGKLLNGQRIIVMQSLVPRLKQHFVQLKQLGVDIILGKNGHIWIQVSSSGKNESANGTATTTRNVELMKKINLEHQNRVFTTEQRENVAMVRNSILLLERCFKSINPTSITKVVGVVQKRNFGAKDLLNPLHAETIMNEILYG